MNKGVIHIERSGESKGFENDSIHLQPNHFFGRHVSFSINANDHSSTQDVRQFTTIGCSLPPEKLP
jgi:hypothetical protein